MYILMYCNNKTLLNLLYTSLDVFSLNWLTRAQSMRCVCIFIILIIRVKTSKSASRFQTSYYARPVIIQCNHYNLTEHILWNKNHFIQHADTRTPFYLWIY